MSRVDATRFIDFDFLDCSQLSLTSTPLPLYPFTPLPLFHLGKCAALILISFLIGHYDAAQVTMRKPPLALLDGRYPTTPYRLNMC